jgi:hypothetical protein
MPHLHQILETFGDSIKKHRSIVFCVKCGSTCIDQNSIDELRCYHCGNSLAWNGYSFSISRELDFSDITHALTTAIRNNFSEWHVEMDETIQKLGTVKF